MSTTKNQPTRWEIGVTLNHADRCHCQKRCLVPKTTNMNCQKIVRKGTLTNSWTPRLTDELEIETKRTILTILLQPKKLLTTILVHNKSVKDSVHLLGSTAQDHQTNQLMVWIPLVLVLERPCSRGDWLCTGVLAAFKGASCPAFRSRPGLLWLGHTHHSPLSFLLEIWKFCCCCLIGNLPLALKKLPASWDLLLSSTGHSAQQLL